MEISKLNYFKERLLKEKMKILNHNRVDGLRVSSDDLSDEADIANSLINQNITFELHQIDRSKLLLVEAALERIDNGSFGTCIDCDEEIEFRRLESTPWTDLCLTHAEEKERELKRKIA